MISYQYMCTGSKKTAIFESSAGCLNVVFNSSMLSILHPRKFIAVTLVACPSNVKDTTFTHPLNPASWHLMRHNLIKLAFCSAFKPCTKK